MQLSHFFTATKTCPTDDAMQMDVHKAFLHYQKMPHVTVTITKKRCVGSNSEVC